MNISTRRFWQKTVSLWVWMRLFIIVFQMPPSQLQMWKMLITQQGFWHKPHCEIQWVLGACMKFSANEWQFQEICRYTYVFNPLFILLMQMRFRKTLQRERIIINFNETLYLKSQLDEATESWGIKVERVEVWVALNNN